MLTYKPNELMSRTDVAKNFGSVLAKLARREVAKIGVLKNTKLYFVIMRHDEIDELMQQEIARLKFEEDKKFVAMKLRSEKSLFSLQKKTQCIALDNPTLAKPFKRVFLNVVKHSLKCLITIDNRFFMMIKIYVIFYVQRVYNHLCH